MVRAGSLNRNPKTKRVSYVLAAASVLIVAIAGAAFVISAKNNSDVKSINRKPKPIETSITTTIANLSSEEKLLANTIVYDNNSLYDSNGKLLENIEKNGLNGLHVVDTSPGYLTLSDGSSECTRYLTVDLNTLSSHVTNTQRVWTPDGTKYFTYEGCDNGKEDAGIVNTNTGKKRVIKLHNKGKTQNGVPIITNLSSVAWVDNDRIIISSNQAYEIGGFELYGPSVYYSLVDTSKDFQPLNENASLLDATCCTEGESLIFYDSTVENGNIFSLVLYTKVENLHVVKKELRVIDMTTGKYKWVKKFELEQPRDFELLTFGKTSNEVYGQELEAGAEVGFGYDHASDITVKRGELMISKSKR